MNSSENVPWNEVKKRRLPGTIGPPSAASTLSSMKEKPRLLSKPKLSVCTVTAPAKRSPPSRVLTCTTPEVASPASASAPVVTTSTSLSAFEPTSSPKPVPASGSLAETPSTT